jgi:hypothetical protein
MSELVLSRTRVRRRRRRRPPRFTRVQKVCIAWDLTATTLCVGSGYVASVAGVVTVSGLALDVRMIVLDAMHGLRPGPWRLLPAALWALGLVLYWSTR